MAHHLVDKKLGLFQNTNFWSFNKFCMTTRTHCSYNWEFGPPSRVDKICYVNNIGKTKIVQADNTMRTHVTVIKVSRQGNTKLCPPNKPVVLPQLCRVCEILHCRKRSNENVELARTIFEFERTLYFIKESCKWFFEKYIYFNFIIKWIIKRIID